MDKFKDKKNFDDFVKARLEKDKADTERRLRDRWENLQPFKTPQDVPTLPNVDKKEWNDYFVPKLIEAGAIPKKDLVDGEYYIGDHRCTRIAQWNEKKQMFNYWKMEFFPHWDHCNHFEDDDGFALFVPIAIGTKEEFDKYSLDNFRKKK